MLPIDRRRFVSAALLGTTLGAGGFSSARAAAAGPRYRVVDLGDLGGGVTFACDIDDHGVVVGETTRRPGNKRGVGFIWERGHMRGLRMELPSVSSRAVAINGNGLVAGLDSDNADINILQSAWTWAGASRQYLPKNGARDSTFATDINDAGLVTGFLYPHNAVLWRDGLMIDLSTETGWRLREARSINNAGDIVGVCQRQDNHLVGYLLRDGQVTTLDVLGSNTHEAQAINEAGQICGSYLRPGSTRPRAFLWQNGVAQDLGALGGDDASARAAGMNDAGVVVGISGRSRSGQGGPYVPRAFVAQGGVIADLNELAIEGADGWVLHKATAINNLGQVIGQGFLRGVPRAYLATPL
jgi:probable HAF family extracellular repeat protein